MNLLAVISRITYVISQLSQLLLTLLNPHKRRVRPQCGKTAKSRIAAEPFFYAGSVGSVKVSGMSGMSGVSADRQEA